MKKILSLLLAVVCLFCVACDNLDSSNDADAGTTTDANTGITADTKWEDIESDIVLDYVIVESDNGYYQMSILDRGLVEIYQEDEPENDNAFYLALQDDDNNFYQFDMENNKAKFTKTDVVNGLVINKLRATVEKKEETVDVVEEPTTKECPKCFSTINIKATKCPHCTSEI